MVTTDVARFEETLAAASAKTASGAERMQRLEAAMALYGGPLLPGFYEEWITAEQERLSGRFFDAAGRLIALREQSGDVAAALEVARRAVAADPLREEAQGHLIRLLAAAGSAGRGAPSVPGAGAPARRGAGRGAVGPVARPRPQIEKQTGLSAPPPLAGGPSPRPVDAAALGASSAGRNAPRPPRCRTR
jgi:hypothetical protein